MKTPIQKKSYFHVFLEKDHLLFSVQRKSIMFSGKKIPPFQIIQGRSCSSANTIFSEHLMKISYFHVFFEKDHLSFSV